MKTVRSAPLTAAASLLCCLLFAPAAVRADDQEGSSLELETCELLVPGTPLSTVAQCGWLTVPENPEEPEGRQIDIRVARVPARGRVAEPDPLVFFAGGPGQSATESWPIVAGALKDVNENRDILLVDQRGTGQSNALKCPQIELDKALALDWEDLARTTRECLEAIDGDPRYYTTTIAMGDTLTEFGQEEDAAALIPILERWVQQGIMYGRMMEPSSVATQVVNAIASEETVRRIAITPHYPHEGGEISTDWGSAALEQARKAQGQ